MSRATEREDEAVTTDRNAPSTGPCHSWYPTHESAEERQEHANTSRSGDGAGMPERYVPLNDPDADGRDRGPG